MSNAEQLAKQVSPVNYVRPGLPPIITIHGEHDVVARFRAVAGNEPTTIEINKNREAFAIRFGRRPVIQIETVFSSAYC